MWHNTLLLFHNQDAQFHVTLSGRFRYYGDYYPLLQSLKAKYDPKDMFSFPVGIEAIGDGGAKIQHSFVH